MSEPNDARHQTYANLETLWSSGNPQILPVSGDPWCEIRLDPQMGEISLRTSYQAPEPDLAKLRNLSFDAMTDGRTEIGVISARVDDNLKGVYGLIAAIADGVQIEGSALAAAVAVAVDQYKEVLSQRGVFLEQAEIGLLGELFFLRHLIPRVGPRRAVEAWLGPMSEEHDFVLPGVHVEVKTTLSERRSHIISGLSQLVPTPGVPLFVMSIQVTRASSDTGITLPGTISVVRQMASECGAELDLKLDRQGWNSDDSDMYRSRWALRTTPRSYLVDDDFPAITGERIAMVVPSLSLVSDLSYRVDLTNIEPRSLAMPYGDFDLPEEYPA